MIYFTLLNNPHYADDNTLSFNHKNIETLQSVLETESNILIDWFEFNQMQANPDKFQSIAVGTKNSPSADRI